MAESPQFLATGHCPQAAQTIHNTQNHYYQNQNESAALNTEGYVHLQDNVAEKLKSRYRNLEVEKGPWILSESLLVTDLYSDLEMIINNKSHGQIALHNIFDDVQGGSPYRILIEGSAGFGKTTVAHKLAADWATGKHYIITRFKLVFLIHLKHFSFDNIDEALVFLGKQTDVDDTTLIQAITQTPEDVLIILDGYDEIPTRKQELLRPLLNGESYPKTTVVVTCRTNQFSSKCGCQGIVTDSKEELLPDMLEFWRKKILITGLKAEKRIDLLKKILTYEEFSRHEENITHIFKDLGELWNCPLYLFMLAVLIKESPGSIRKNTQSVLKKTQLYTSFFNWMIGRFLGCQPNTVDLLQAVQRHAPVDSSNDFAPLGNSTFQESSNASEIDEIACILSEFGKLALQKRRDGSTKFSESDISHIENGKTDFLLKLGILTKGSDHYEVIHHSLIEFLVAFHLFQLFGSENRDNQQLLKCIRSVRNQYSMVLPFLAGLLQDESHKLFEILKPFAYEYCACISYLVPLLLECDVSENLLTSLTPFLPVLWPMPCCDNDSGFVSTPMHKDIVKHGIQEGRIKMLLWKINTKVSLCEDTEVDQLHVLVSGAISESDIDNIPPIQCKDIKILTLNNYQMTEATWERFITCVCTLFEKQRIETLHVSLHIRDNAEEWLPSFHKELLDGRLANYAFFWIRCCLREKKQHLMPKLIDLIKNERTKGLELVFDKALSSSLCSQNLCSRFKMACRARKCNNVLPRQVRKILQCTGKSKGTVSVHLRDRERVMIEEEGEQKWLVINLKDLSKKHWTWLRFWSVSLDEGSKETIRVRHLDFVDVQCSFELIEGLRLSELQCLAIDSAFLCESSLRNEQCKFDQLEVLDVVLSDSSHWKTVFDNFRYFHSISVLALTMSLTSLKYPFLTDDFISLLRTLPNLKTLQFYGVNRSIELVHSIVASLHKNPQDSSTLPVSVLCLQMNSYQESGTNSSSANNSSQVKVGLSDLLSQGKELLRQHGLQLLQIICSPNCLPQIVANSQAVICLETVFPYQEGFQITHDFTGMKRGDPPNYRHDFDLFGGYHRFLVQYEPLLHQSAKSIL